MSPISYFEFEPSLKPSVASSTAGSIDASNPVVCMHETPRQLIRETRQPIAAAPGRPGRHDYE